MCCHASLRVDGQASFDKLPRRNRDRAPVFERGERVVGNEDSLHFFEIGVPIKRGVAAEEEICYYAYCPDVADVGVSMEWSEDLKGTHTGFP